MRRWTSAGVSLVAICACVSGASVAGQEPLAVAGPADVGDPGGPGDSDAMTLWYDEPAPDTAEGWESRSLPIGNGALGATVRGGVETEILQFNEKTLWTGGPGSEQGYNFGNWIEPRPGALERVQQRIDDELSADPEWVADQLGQPKRGYGAYQTFGDLVLDVGEQDGEVTGYRRSLDIGDSVARVHYTADGVTYTREYFASEPDGVIVARLSADTPGSVDLHAAVRTPDNRTASVHAADGRITLAGTLDDNGLRFESQIQLRHEGGSSTDRADGSVRVEDADTVTLILAAGTDYEAEYPDYRGTDPHDAVTARVDEAAEKSYTALHDAHVSDHRELFDRFSLDLGQQLPDLPTDELLAAYRDGTLGPAGQRALEVLYTQYGRYLLIASSRPGSLPANLQGVWNESTSPPWGADYHVNINLQMNYWPAETTNLSETTAPLFDYVDSLVPAGEVTAEEMFGNRGWVVHNETTPYGFTGVHDWATAFWFPEAGAWLAQHYYEHYLFTRDETFLRERAYPVMKGLAQFWMDELVVDPRDGTLVVNPSYSPEHGDFSAGAAMSQQIVWDLLTNVVEAAQIVGDDAAFRADVQDTLADLDPGTRVGSWGQLQEWKEDWDDPGNTHRHVSHLFGLHPGRQFSPHSDPRLAEAAEVSLNARGDGGTGWSKAWKINFWARLLDGDHAHTMLSELLKNSTLDNLWDTHPPFQIDGNFGATAGVAEMLLQSHDGVIDVLPALPGVWADGSYDGLRARGGVTVGATWRSGTASEIRVTADHDGPLTLRTPMTDGEVRIYQDHGRQVPFTVDGDALTLDVDAGVQYRIVAQYQAGLDVPDEQVSPGDEVPVTVTVAAADRLPRRPSEAVLDVPDGWTSQPESVQVPAGRPGSTASADVTVTVPDGTANGAYPITVAVMSEHGTVRGRAVVEVWRPNLALDQPAAQSSTAHDAGAGRAVDGDTSGQWGNGSVTHTVEDGSPEPYWQVDLGSVRDIDDIAVWNRTDCCAERLSDYHVLVSDEPFASTTLEEVLDQAGVWSRHEAGPGGTPTRVDVGRTGRYVRVQLTGSDPLSLAEVQVFGS